ncbi:hypothetical protein FKM82_003786 [Ascaphus truei]
MLMALDRQNTQELFSIVLHNFLLFLSLAEVLRLQASNYTSSNWCVRKQTHLLFLYHFMEAVNSLQVYISIF